MAPTMIRHFGAGQGWSLGLLGPASMLVLAIGCTAISAGDADETLALPTNPVAMSDDVPGMSAALEGRLVWDEPTGCLLIDPDDGRAGPVAAIWPRGFSLHADPLAVHDEDGEFVAGPGDVVSTGGGVASDPERAGTCAEIAVETWSISLIDHVNP